MKWCSGECKNSSYKLNRIYISSSSNVPEEIALLLIQRDSAHCRYCGIGGLTIDTARFCVIPGKALRMKYLFTVCEECKYTPYRLHHKIQRGKLRITRL